MNEYLSIISIDHWTIIFTIVNFFIVYFIIKKFLYKPIKNIMEQRKSEIDKTYLEANEMKQNARDLEKYYNDKIKNADHDANIIVSEANKKGQMEYQEILDNAKLKSMQIIDSAHTQIEKDKKLAVSKLKTEISDISIMIASKIIEREINTTNQNDIIEKIINDLDDEQWGIE